MQKFKYQSGHLKGQGSRNGFLHMAFVLLSLIAVVACLL